MAGTGAGVGFASEIRSNLDVLETVKSRVAEMSYVVDPAPLALSEAPARPYHHFTVDVEEYFQVSAMEPYVSRAQWDGMPSRVVAQTRQLLELLARHEVRGTFFILGWIAERHPGLVGEIASQGHEIASHGWDHARVTQLTPESFRESVRRTRHVLESITGREVAGYRAPSFSIVPGREWALDILLQEGYGYDSSLFPVSRRGYGYPGAGRDPYWIECPSGTLIEMPPATLRRFGLTVPAAGGGYLRLLPLGLMQAAIDSTERRNASATLYIHPWELDPAQPRIDVNWPTRVRHYGGLRRTADRLTRLLSAYRFKPIVDTYALMVHPA
jgi:polysaccharide deacetylase family protein (PEP-CTERM system associated)